MKLKQVTKFLMEEGKKLPKPVWVAVLVLPLGLEVLGAYLAFKYLTKQKTTKEILEDLIINTKSLNKNSFTQGAKLELEKWPKKEEKND